jgi:hypothetical protein
VIDNDSQKPAVEFTLKLASVNKTKEELKTDLTEKEQKVFEG